MPLDPQSTGPNRRSEGDRQPLRLGPLLAGLLLVGLGVALALDQLDVVEVDVWATVGQLWPLIVVVVGGGMLRERRWIEGTTITLIGLLLLGSTTGVGPEVGFELIAPIVLVAVGVGIIGGVVRRPGAASGSTALFGGLEREVDPSDPTPEAVTAMFGGYEIRVADRPPVAGARLSAVAMFGGIEIEVPETVPVRIVRRRALFGGVETNVREAPRDETAYEIEASVMFGGVEINRR